MTEDFVTFELAKKLKEKGYTLDTAHHYDDNGGIVVSLVEFDERCVYPCPEIHQVLKWLREEKKLHIELWTVGKKPIKWCHTITTLNHVGERQGWSSGERGDSYEAAAIEGIKYTLDNLI